jgi:hypothetical protein
MYPVSVPTRPCLPRKAHNRAPRGAAGGGFGRWVAASGFATSRMAGRTCRSQLEPSAVQSLAVALLAHAGAVNRRL